MIKIDNGTVHIEGRGIQVLTELTILLKTIRDMTDDESVDKAVAASKSKLFDVFYKAIQAEKKDEKSDLDRILEALEELAEGGA